MTFLVPSVPRPNPVHTPSGRGSYPQRPPSNPVYIETGFGDAVTEDGESNHVHVHWLKSKGLNHRVPPRPDRTPIPPAEDQ